MNKPIKQVFIICSLLIVIITLIRNFQLPFNHDEAATFFHFIQPGDFLPYVSEPDANNHLLNSLLAYTTFKLFGDSPFSLRFPNILALLLLIYGIFKISKHLQNKFTVLILIAGFLVSFHWLSFFNISRGYGLSMGVFLLGISFFIDYLKNQKNSYLILLFICIQFAIAANLTLIVSALLITAFLFYHQLRNNFSGVTTWIINIIHITGLLYWVKYSFYLKENNALYYGSGESYFYSTFHSLVELITGFPFIWLSILILLSGIAIIAFNLIKNLKSIFKRDILKNSPFTFSLISFSLVIGFYILNKIAGINYPEDRTGLFFYVFFILVVALTLDRYDKKINNYISFSIFTLAIIHFFSQLNFTRHSVPMYATFPHHFYDKLVSEQNINKNKISIGGHRMSELSFNFMNYRNEGHLNPLDPHENIELLHDYIISNKKEFKTYKELYDEISYDSNHEIVLLKRKEKANKKVSYSSTEVNILESEHEYINIFENSELKLNSTPLIAEINFTILEVTQPSLAWIVFYGEGNGGTFYERIPLNWMKYNWKGESANYQLQTSYLSAKPQKIIVYIWNRKLEKIKVQINSLSIYQATSEEFIGN